jgi:hypothetical protein
MNAEETEEPSIVVGTYTVVDPDTMMIKASYTVVTEFAMLRSGWFDELTRITLTVLIKDAAVMFIHAIVHCVVLRGNHPWILD